MRFKNREHAATQLANALSQYKDKNPLVLGIPRGAVPMAEIIAQSLNGELGAILVHKIPAPQNPEFAIGSIGLSGKVQLMPYAAAMHVTEDYIQNQAAEELSILKQRQKFYGLKEPNYKDRIVIIVDDGIATGATVLSAISEVRLGNPKEVVVAAPVASQESGKKIRSETDKYIVLDEPEFFYAVGQFYEDFAQVTDPEVIEIFKRTH